MINRGPLWRLLVSDGDVRIDDAYTGVHCDAEQADIIEALMEGNELHSISTQAMTNRMRNADIAIGEWISRGWGPSLRLYLRGRDALSKRPAGAAHAQLRLPNVDVGDLIGRRTQRTYLKARSGKTVVLQLLQFLRGIEMPMGVDVVTLVYDGGDGTAYTDRQLFDGTGWEPLGESTAIRSRMIDAMAGMTSAQSATVTFIFALDERVLSRPTADDYTLLDVYFSVGRIAQLLVIFGESLEFGSLVTPGFSDSALSELLNLSEQHVPVYSVTMGRRRSSSPPDAIQ